MNHRSDNHIGCAYVTLNGDCNRNTDPSELLPSSSRKHMRIATRVTAEYRQMWANLKLDEMGR